MDQLFVNGVQDAASKQPSTSVANTPETNTPDNRQIVNTLTEQILQRAAPRRTLLATYRFQFHGAGFRFEDATRRADYLRALGVSHVYSSPILQAQSGSMHGYDVIDPTCLNEELGSEEQYAEMLDAFSGQQIGQVLDIVPNHMSVVNDQNRWWMDVLKHGPSSRFARFFDIDWQPPRSQMNGRVLLPVLSAASGKVLEAGQLQIRFKNGGFYVECNGCLLPLDPKSWSELLETGSNDKMIGLLAGMSPTVSADEPNADYQEDEGALLELQSIVAAIKHLPDRGLATPESIAERMRETLVIEQRLDRVVRRSIAVAELIESNLRAINGNPDQPASFNRLESILEMQAYRLVHWRASSDEINYRRFFDVSTLAALSVENLDVFEATHALLIQLAATARVDAFRVDHVDGLFDPTQYLWRLQWSYLREVGKLCLDQIMLTDAQKNRATQCNGHDCSPRTSFEIRWTDIEPEVLDALHQRLGGVHPATVLREPKADNDIKLEADKQFSDYSQQPKAVEANFLLPVYVEKILGSDEPLPPHWPVLGTTGYEFLNELNGVFIHEKGFVELRKTYDRFVGEQLTFDEIIYRCKHIILTGAMQSEITLLASRLDRIASRSRYHRDFTLNSLEFALREIIACFSVYRTYIERNCISSRDKQILLRAIASAKRRNPASETEAFDFVRDLLLMSEPMETREEDSHQRDYLVGRFQQVTSPVQAKGIEDTAFYRYIPLLSINEVGGEPRFAVKSQSDFHEQNLRRHQHWPQSMLTTSTHDTKRSEDVRARVNVLSEVPGQWRKALNRWHRLNRKHIRQVDGHDAPCRNDQWLFYQTLIGVWPTNPPDVDERQQLIHRLVQYMEKATHEAKMHTSWISPNKAYDVAVKEFVEEVLSDASSKFSSDLQEFVDSIVENGLVNAASQVLLKLTSPGVPDIYQVQELWDFSLVDPDNRRVVDYDLRNHLLMEIQQAIASPAGRVQFARNLSRNPRDNRLKLFVTLHGLQFRKRLGAEGPSLRYVPLSVTGPAAEHWIAFGWYRVRGEQLQLRELVAVPRFLQTLQQQAHTLGSRLDQFDWGDTFLEISSEPKSEMFNAFTGLSVEVGKERLQMSELVRDFPLVLLTSNASGN